MRYRLIALTLFAVLPVMSVLAAPAPEPYAILDIGPPPGDPGPKTLDKHRKSEIDRLTHPRGVLSDAWRDPEVNKLRSVAALEDARPWLSKTLRVTDLDGGTRLRITFRGGNRTEQVVILNALLRSYLRAQTKYVQWHEDILKRDEACVVELARRIASGQHRADIVALYRKGIDELRSTDIPKQRAFVAALKKVAVIKWAK